MIACINKKIDVMLDDLANNANHAEILRAARAVTSCAQALLASEGVQQFAQHEALQQTIKTGLQSG